MDRGFLQCQHAITAKSIYTDQMAIANFQQGSLIVRNLFIIEF